MVSEVSAIEVASTTLRRPGGAGSMARSCTAHRARRIERHDIDRRIVIALGEKSSRCGGFRPAPGRKASTEPARRAARAAIASAICRSSGVSRIAAEIARLDRKGAAFAFDHGRAVEQLRDPRAVKRRRHHENPQVFAQTPLRVERQRQPEIGIERALVKFVEQHGGDAVQFRIVENQPGENALGDHLDPGRARHLRAEADAIAHRLAHPLAERLRHALGGGARRDPARFQHDDLPPFAQGSSSSASGTRVVLPAPGGATSTAALAPASASVQRSAARRRSGEAGSKSRRPALGRGGPQQVTAVFRAPHQARASSRAALAGPRFRSAPSSRCRRMNDIDDDQLFRRNRAMDDYPVNDELAVAIRLGRIDARIEGRVAFVMWKPAQRPLSTTAPPPGRGNAPCQHAFHHVLRR